MKLLTPIAQSIFGTGTSSILSNTYEWTYTSDTSSLTHHPVGWCLSGTTTCAEFFGGKTSISKYALMWQWSGGGGTTATVTSIRSTPPVHRGWIGRYYSVDNPLTDPV
jgi:hypothetical protein